MRTIAALAFVLLSSTAFAAEYDTNPARPTTADRVGGGVGDWVGFAASPQGRVFRTDYTFRTEESARQNAREMCERTTARTCMATISIPAEFDVVAINCNRQATFFGASKLDLEDDAAFGKARKAGYNDCKVIMRY